MYFIKYSRCSVCRQKKTVALNKKTLSKKICSDCDSEYYHDVAQKQKEYWINGGKKNARNR